MNYNHYTEVDTNHSDYYKTERVQLIAPMFDYFGEENLAFIFRESDFYSNHKNSTSVNTIEYSEKNNWTSISFDEIINFTPNEDSLQRFQFRLIYNDGDTISNEVIINTPNYIKSKNDGGTLCHLEKTFEDSQGNKLIACLVPSCFNRKDTILTGPIDIIIPIVDKPYILVAGWRPPIFGQSFEKTWKLYNEYHDHLLSQLTLNGYDVYLVKFNIQWNPIKHGMIESADLFVEFLEYVNDEKVNKYNENVIQGSSMGADVVRLALLKMEDKHQTDNSYPHHHSRLFISHDANYYGANIPLAYQYQIYSSSNQTASSYAFGVPFTFFLKLMLHQTMEQKTFKELLTYHALGTSQTGSPANLLTYNNEYHQITPSHHHLRQIYLDELDAYDNQESIVPLPNSTRNIAISLGKISGTNNLSNTNKVRFKAAGTYWWDVDLWIEKHQLRSAIYSPTWHERLFRRKRIGISFVNFSLNMDHIIDVKGMQEVDNASGSYLKGFGNIISVADWTYFTLGNFLNGKNHFSHKSVITALAINEDLWPADGSLTLNMQSLGLMYNVLNYHPINNLSDHYGYPNLGRPNDHFDVTPFEAIYVDNKIDPHINLEGSDGIDKTVLTNFIKDEVEPWFLSLQNDVLGSQARPNFLYKSQRVAKYNIVVGHLVTPKTDPGDYVVAPNADLVLKAGQAIDLFTGTTFLEGSTATLTIEYEGCDRNKSSDSNGNTETSYISTNENRLDDSRLTDFIEKSEIRIFPNPSDGTFTITCMQDIPISHFVVYDLSGNLVLEKRNINVARYKCENCLDKGIYIVHIYLKGVLKRKKIIIS